MQYLGKMYKNYASELCPKPQLCILSKLRVTLMNSHDWYKSQSTLLICFVNTQAILHAAVYFCMQSCIFLTHSPGSMCWSSASWN